AVIQDALDVIVSVGWHAGESNTASVGDGAKRVRRRLPVDETVLQVHGKPGEPGSRQKPRRRDAAQRQPGADRRLACFQSTFDRVGTHEESSKLIASKNNPESRKTGIVFLVFLASSLLLFRRGF